MSNNIRILNLDPQEITINGTGTPTGITNVYVNGIDVTVGTKAYVIVPTKLSELTNDEGFITNAEETDPTVPYYVKEITMADINAWNDKQDGLVSGVNIKTINNNSLLGSGDIQITATEYVAGTGIDITGNVISNTITSYDDLTDLPTPVTRTSQLINDSGFITNQVDDLEYYIPISDLENILPSTSDSGTDELYLKDSAKYKMKITLSPQEFQQETTTGKNLLPNNGETKTQNGITFTKNNDGSVSVSGLASGDASYNLIVRTDPSFPAGTYIMNGCPAGGSLSTYYLYISPSVSASRTDTGSGVTFSLVSDETNIVSINIKSGYNANTNPLIFYPMLRESSIVDGSYEEYTGGMASPNPLYPEDLHVITGENSITVGNKNLLDISDMTSGGGITKNEDNSITLNGNVTSKSFTLTKPFILKANQPYTLSITNSDPSYSASAFILRNGSTNITDVTFNNLSTQYTPSVDKVVDTLRIYNGTGTFNNFTFSVQLEYGSTATDYVPHQETVYPIDLEISGQPIEYCKIGDYKDRFFKNLPSDPRYHDNWPYGRWYREANVQKVNLMDNNNFDDIQTGLGYYQFENTDPVNIPRPPLLDYEGISYYFNPNNTDHNHIQILSNHIIIQMNDKIGITSLEDLNDWLYNNQVTAYFKCEEGTAQIYGTSDTLNNQLEAIHNAIAYDGGTIISQTNDDLAFDITASAFKKVS